MLDASAGFLKDGNKNRLRDQDIHKIVDIFTHLFDTPKYARMVPFSEIEKNDFNLNLPRYIDSQEPEDLQDIEGHLKGGIPVADIDALKRYWTVCPGLRDTLFKLNRPDYLDLAVDKAEIRATIYGHPEFRAFLDGMNAHFEKFRAEAAVSLRKQTIGDHPKKVIGLLSEDLLRHYTGKPLIDRYDIYQHLMDYWNETMQDDCYLIASDGWKAETYRIIEKDKNGKERDKGWACDLIPKSLIVRRYFQKEQDQIDELSADLDRLAARIAELEEEQGGEDGAFAELEKVNRAEVTKRLKEIKGDPDAADEATALNKWLDLADAEAHLKRELKQAEADLDASAYAHYPTLIPDQIQALVVDDKWLRAIKASVQSELELVISMLTQRVTVLGSRYALDLPKLGLASGDAEDKVRVHLRAMGFQWS